MIKYRPKQFMITSYHGQLPITKNIVLIIQFDTVNNTWIPSSLSEIVYVQYCKNSINTILSKSRTICNFLNYINKQILIAESQEFLNLKERGLYGINLIHASKYLTYLNNFECNSYKTVHGKERTLLEFYDYLINKGLLDKSVYLNHYQSNKTVNGISIKVDIIESPFNTPPFSVIYPMRNKKNTKKTLKNLNQAEWELLLELAENEYPEIVLGIAFQIMGGLRCGEIVNLLISSKIGRAHV